MSRFDSFYIEIDILVVLIFPIYMVHNPLR